LPREDAFAASAGRAGIGDGVFVVAYDHGAAGGAARLWWLLRHLGHDDVAVLRDGFDSWLGPVRGGEEAIEPRELVPRTREGDTVDANELAARLGEPGLVVVDARSPERYRGETEPIDPVAGHIPGAVNWFYAEAAEPPPEIAEADEIVVYCGSGITACVDLLLLARAGRPDAKLYPGSWSDWCQRELPVERG
jgi:thiosulfate/3-mercaptopyruvate sulfurtransferase